VVSNVLVLAVFQVLWVVIPLRFLLFAGIDWNLVSDDSSYGLIALEGGLKSGVADYWIGRVFKKARVSAVG